MVSSSGERVKLSKVVDSPSPSSHHPVPCFSSCIALSDKVHDKKEENWKAADKPCLLVSQSKLLEILDASILVEQFVVSLVETAVVQRKVLGR